MKYLYTDVILTCNANYNKYLNFNIFLENYLTYKGSLNYKFIFIIKV